MTCYSTSSTVDWQKVNSRRRHNIKWCFSEISYILCVSQATPRIHKLGRNRDLLTYLCIIVYMYPSNILCVKILFPTSRLGVSLVTCGVLVSWMLVQYIYFQLKYTFLVIGCVYCTDNNRSAIIKAASNFQ